MIKMEITPYTRKANYYETDQMGVIHHSNYIRWFEEARIDFLEQAGFGYKKMEDAGIISPVLAVACEYKSMVRFGDTVTIHVGIESMTGVRMIVTYRVEDAQSGELRTIGETRHCFLNTKGRPVSLEKALPEVLTRFKALMAPPLVSED